MGDICDKQPWKVSVVRDFIQGLYWSRLLLANTSSRRGKYSILLFVSMAKLLVGDNFFKVIFFSRVILENWHQSSVVGSSRYLCAVSVWFHGTFLFLSCIGICIKGHSWVHCAWEAFWMRVHFTYCISISSQRYMAERRLMATTYNMTLLLKYFPWIISCF